MGVFAGHSRMDVYRYLKELHAHKRRLDATIQRLEAALAKDAGGSAAPAGRRGRKPGMSAEERKLISLRMRNYWAKRRAKAARDGGASGKDEDSQAASA